MWSVKDISTVILWIQYKRENGKKKILNKKYKRTQEKTLPVVFCFIMQINLSVIMSIDICTVWEGWEIASFHLISNDWPIKERDISTCSTWQPKPSSESKTSLKTRFKRPKTAFQSLWLILCINVYISPEL